MELHVGNLDHKMTVNELRDIFSPYGKIVSARIFTDYYTRQRRDFGFVRMSTRSEGYKAIIELHGKAINNRPLIVKEVLL
ncbi:MAG: RNA-binding protein [Thermodesulfobacteriota bacterium]|nr:RNA-binding protein [Thermodesulfobacteriota bacterium]